MRIGSLDFGLKKDWAVFVVVDGDSRMTKMIHKKIWKGSTRNQVSVSATEKYIKAAAIFFQLDLLVIEQWQMVGTIERLRGELNCPVEEFIPSAQSVVAISENFYQFVQRGSFRFPASDIDYRTEMLELEAAESKDKSSDKTAFKIIYKRHAGGQGHGDTTRAIAMALYLITTRYRRPIDEILNDVVSANRDGGSSVGGKVGVDNDMTPVCFSDACDDSPFRGSINDYD